MTDLISHLAIGSITITHAIILIIIAIVIPIIAIIIIITAIIIIITAIIIIITAIVIINTLSDLAIGRLPRLHVARAQQRLDLLAPVGHTQCR